MQASLTSLGGSSGREALQMLEVEAHRFAGSGTTFGLPELSRLAKEIEQLVRGRGQELPLPRNVRARLTGLVDALWARVVKSAGEVPIPVRSGEGRRLVKALLVDGDTELARSCETAKGLGWPIRVFKNEDEAVEDAIYQPPDVVLVAADQKSFDGLMVCQRLRAAGVLRVGIFGSKTEIGDRLVAVKAGIEAFLPRPPDAESLLRFAAEFARTRPGARVLALDADTQRLEDLAEALVPWDIAVEPCTDPSMLFELVHTTSPALILVHALIGGVQGVDLVRALRSDPSSRRLPVILMANDEATVDRVAALAAGADDFLRRPSAPEELAATLLAHLRRRSREGHEPGRDPLTGAWTRRHLLEIGQRSLSLARRAGRSLAFIAFDCDMPIIRRERGKTAANEVMVALAAHLATSFRGSDIIARLEEGRFAALLEEVSAKDAERLVQSVESGFASRRFRWAEGIFTVKVRAGIALFPDTRGSAEDLLAAAEGAL
jgi:diguanylate cyclase (GGDEF)-like protein